MVLFCNCISGFWDFYPPPKQQIHIDQCCSSVFCSSNHSGFLHQAPENADVSSGFSGKRQVSTEARSKAGVMGHVMNFCGVRKTLSASHEAFSVQTQVTELRVSAGLLKYLTQRILHATLRPPIWSSSPDLINPRKCNEIQLPWPSTTRFFGCRHPQNSHQCLLWLWFQWCGHWALE